MADTRAQLLAQQMANVQPIPKAAKKTEGQKDVEGFRNTGAEIYTRITGKAPNPNEGILSQVDQAMRDAVARGKLSEENAELYRRQFESGSPGPRRR